MAQRWVWPKKPLREEVNPKGNAKYYAKADLVNSRTKETVYSIKVGDPCVICDPSYRESDDLDLDQSQNNDNEDSGNMRVDAGDSMGGNQEQYWVCICTELCMFSPERFINEDQATADEDLKTLAKVQERMRIGVRWLYRQCDYDKDCATLAESTNEGGIHSPRIPKHLRTLPKLALKNKEVCMTDFFSGPECNSLTNVEESGAVLFSSKREMDEHVKSKESEGLFVAPTSYFCNTFYWTIEVDDEVDISVLEKYPTKSRIRPLAKGELAEITSGDIDIVNDRSRFWTGRKEKHQKKGGQKHAQKRVEKVRSSTAKPALAPDAAPVQPSSDAAAVFAAEQQKKMMQVQIEDILPGEQLDLLRRRVKELTPEQCETLHLGLATITKELTRHYIGGVQKRNKPKDFGEYPSERKDALDKACAKYWEMLNGTDVEAKPRK